MAEEARKESLGEKIQNAFITISLLLGLRQRPASGSPEESRIPDWVLSAVPEEFTGEDEAWRKLILSSCDDTRIFKIEEEFRKRFVDDPDWFDPGKYRTRLMDAKKEWLEQSRKPVIKNEPQARLNFPTTTFRDPCNDFFSLLIQEVDKHGTPEDIYNRQKQVAIGLDYLVRMNGVKKAIHWSRNHKAETLVGIVLFPWAIVQFVFWLFG